MSNNDIPSDVRVAKGLKAWDQATRDYDPPYSRKILLIQNIFHQAFSANQGRYLFILLNPSHELEGHTYNQPMTAREINGHINRTYAKHSHDQRPTLIALMDLAYSFDEQICSGMFDPFHLVSWETLKYYPLDCVSPQMKRLSDDRADLYLLPAPVIKAPSIKTAWNNPDPKAYGWRRPVDLRPREHLSLVVT